LAIIGPLPLEGRATEKTMCERDDRDDWLEGVRRWYFGGTPGPDDDTAPGAEVESMKPAGTSSWPPDASATGLGHHA
jgi:hypothetical protein